MLKQLSKQTTESKEKLGKITIETVDLSSLETEPSPTEDQLKTIFIPDLEDSDNDLIGDSANDISKDPCKDLNAKVNDEKISNQPE